MPPKHAGYLPAVDEVKSMQHGSEAGSGSRRTRQSSAGDVMDVGGDNKSASSSGMAAGGRLTSALLAKHVRTLEVLYSLQRENARVRQEGKVRVADC